MPTTLATVTVKQAAASLARRAFRRTKQAAVKTAVPEWLADVVNPHTTSAISRGIQGAGVGALGGLGLGLLRDDDEARPFSSAITGALAGGAIGAGGQALYNGVSSAKTKTPEEVTVEKYKDLKSRTEPGVVGKGIRSAAHGAKEVATDPTTYKAMGALAPTGAYEGQKLWRSHLAKNYNNLNDPTVFREGLNSLAANKVPGYNVGALNTASRLTDPELQNLVREMRNPTMGPHPASGPPSAVTHAADLSQNTPINAQNMQEVWRKGLESRIQQAGGKGLEDASRYVRTPATSSWSSGAEQPRLNISKPWLEGAIGRRPAGVVGGAAKWGLPLLAAQSMFGGSRDPQAQAEMEAMLAQNPALAQH